jgi:hypothetical protein
VLGELRSQGPREAGLVGGVRRRLLGDAAYVSGDQDECVQPLGGGEPRPGQGGEPGLSATSSSLFAAYRYSDIFV